MTYTSTYTQSVYLKRAHSFELQRAMTSQRSFPVWCLTRMRLLTVAIMIISISTIIRIIIIYSSVNK